MLPDEAGDKITDNTGSHDQDHIYQHTKSAYGILYYIVVEIELPLQISLAVLMPLIDDHVLVFVVLRQIIIV